MIRSLLFATCAFMLFVANASAQSDGTFNPTVKWKFLIHSRYEASLSDSVDVQNKFNSDPINSNFRIRRLELRSDITFTPKLSSTIRLQLPELKGTNIGRTIELAYVNYKVTDAFQIRAGQYKLPYELDEQTSHEELRMIDRGPTSVMFVNNSLASYQPGIMIFGNLLKDKTPLNYYLSVTNGSNRAVPYDDNSQKNYTARLEYYPIKGVRIAANAQIIGIPDETGNSFGGDLQIIKNISKNTQLIVEGEYIQGLNVSVYASDTSASKDINDYNMGGFFGQALFKININKKWCKVFEIGGKYENTDPITSVDENAFSTITGDIGFNFLPDNDARLQLNIIHTNWETPIGGTIDASNMFVAQFQIKI